MRYKAFLKSTNATVTTLLASIALLQISERCTCNSSVECKSVRSSYVSAYAYAYVAGVLTCYAYVMLMH